MKAAGFDFAISQVDNLNELVRALLPDVPLPRWAAGILEARDALEIQSGEAWRQVFFEGERAIRAEVEEATRAAMGGLPASGGTGSNE
jgi:hypothetical protein